MKILHLSKFYKPDPGGLEQVVAHLAEGAADAGHEVRVVAATGSSWVRDPGLRLTVPPQRNVVVARLPTFGILWSQPIAPGYLAAARWPADVVHLHHPHPLADMAAALAPKRPLVITHHADVRRQTLAKPFYGPWLKTALKRASAVAVPTWSHFEVSEELKDFEDKVRVIPFGVDHERFKPRPDYYKRPACFPEDASVPVALFVGRLVGYKGLDVLVDAVRGSDLHVVIVGDGPEREAVAARIAESGLGDQIVMAGEVNEFDLLGYYDAASYIVLPSISLAEMFGITLIEAMAMERPVITTDLQSGVREVNEKDVTGLVVPIGDAVELRGAMERLAGDPSLRERLGKAGRARVLERFTLEKMIAGHLELYEELVR